MPDFRGHVTAEFSFIVKSNNFFFSVHIYSHINTVVDGLRSTFSLIYSVQCLLLDFFEDIDCFAKLQSHDDPISFYRDCVHSRTTFLPLLLDRQDFNGLMAETKVPIINPSAVTWVFRVRAKAATINKFLY